MKVIAEGKPAEGTKHRLTITNEETGEVEIDIPHCNGGFFVCNDEDDNPVGTKQAIFGSVAAIAISTAKSEAVISQVIKQAPPEVGIPVQQAREMIAELIKSSTI